MALPEYDRYSDLVNAVPGGSFYSSSGVIIPYRSGMTTVRLETSSVNTTFGVYLNEVFSGTVISDGDGNVVFERHLPKGEVEVTLLNSTTGKKLFTWLTVRDYALWLASYAEALEDIDESIETEYNDLAIETATISGVEDHFGKAIGLYNNLGQSLDDFRKTLHELRLAYRNFGSRFRGLETAVAEFTQIPPFGYSRRLWGPNWVLDQSMLRNHRFLDRSCAVVNTTGNITGITVDGVEADLPQNAAAGTLTYTSATNEFTWSPGGSAGVSIEAAEGELFLPGPAETRQAFMLGGTSPYSITAGINDYLYLNIDRLGSIAIQLTTGLPTPTAANIAADVNAALVADVRYGAGYAAFASVYNGKLLFASPVPALSYDTTKIIMEHGVQNAAIDIFGNRSGNVTVDSYEIFGGCYILGVDGDINLNQGLPAFVEYSYDGSTTPVTRTLRWRSPNTILGLATPITQPGEYQLTDGVGHVLRVYCYPDEMTALAAPWPATSIWNITLGFQREEENQAQTQGLYITVTDPTLLPAGVTNDTISVADDETLGFPETPDDWSIWTVDIPNTTTWLETSDVIRGKNEALDPSSAFKWRFRDVGTTREHKIFGRAEKWQTALPKPRGTNFPQRSPNLLYDYEGFEVKFSGYVRAYNVVGIGCKLGMSFDGGQNITYGATYGVVNDTGALGYEDPTYVEMTTIIPAGIDEDWNAVSLNRGVIPVIWFSGGAGYDVSMDGFAVEVKYISSRYLTNATVSRDRHNQYFGELDWIWSIDSLSLVESAYMGLQHKRSDRSNPFAGVTLNTISTDTPAGQGTIDYEYNSVGNTHRLRWNAYNDAWGAGVGWVTILSDGTYTLSAPGGSYVTVDVLFSLLPVLSGTPPAATRSRNIIISDETVDQGHVRRISPAHAAIEIYDTTEYDASGDSINLVGAVSEGDFSFCTLNNLDVSSSTPFKFAYCYPNQLNVEDETLSVNPATRRAPLAYASDQNQTDAILYGDGEIIPNTDSLGNPLWWFNNAQEIEIAAAEFVASAVYTIDYNLLYQLTTPVFPLGSAYQDYAWWADYMLWDRMDAELGEYEATIPLIFNPDIGRAYLDQPSTMDKSVASLVYQNSADEREVAKRYWRFINDRTVEIDVSQFVRGAQYTLTHEEKRVYENSRLTVTFEHRSATTSVGVTGASWNEIERNENVTVDPNNHQYHQLRLSVSGIRDLRDFRIRSLVLKGLHIHGTSPDVNGLTNVWGSVV